ncbi:MAG TPA: TetR/AcrR family transcriptional regulator [Nitrolancea sp.]|nr:TetR/AcrR family transcriptional regulator [Nitrolancea sp.]
MASELRSEARERVLVVAERLFSERGYSSVTLRDIATELGIRQASLYHHVPDGKEQLYVEVTERGLDRARFALERAIDAGGLSLRDQLAGAARYLLSQPPFDLARMIRSDMPAISEIHARRLTQTALNSLVRPIERAFAAARTRGEHHMPSERLLASSFLAIIETIQVSQRFTPMPGETMAGMMIDVLLDGLHPRT